MPIKVLFLLLLLAAISAVTNVAQTQPPPIDPGVSQQLARWRAERYSDVRYKLNLTLEKMSPVLKGTVEIRVNVATRMPSPASPQTGELAPIILDWRKIKGSEALSTVSNVSLNGVPSVLSPGFSRPSSSPEKPPEGGTQSAYEEINEHLVFREGVKPGENVIRLDFTSPILASGSAVTRYVDKEDGSEYIYSLFVPSDASTAFPVFDQPDLKARFKLNVEFPYGWRVVSNTELKASGQGVRGQGSTIVSEYLVGEFDETSPISTYVFAFAAGPWVEFDDAAGTGRNPSSSEGAPQRSIGKRGTLPIGRVSAGRDEARVGSPTVSKGSTSSSDHVEPSLTVGLQTQSRIFVRKSQAEKFKPHAAEVFRLNREAVKYLEEYFDYKFPFPKYDLVLIPEFPFGGMEHAGATFLRESSIIFPQEPTANDFISRANLIFHEAAHQWFGDTVTMRWFDDLWLKEGFAEFMAYKTLERVMPQYNAWKAFYERNKPLAYQTDSTKGTVPIYQEIPNLNSAKSAYGNIVYRKAPSFLKQAEFYLGADKFQTAVRAFLKKHEFKNAGWTDLVKEFETATRENLKDWATRWVTQPRVPMIRMRRYKTRHFCMVRDASRDTPQWPAKLAVLQVENEYRNIVEVELPGRATAQCTQTNRDPDNPQLVFPNYQDHSYGIFLLDPKSRDYVLKNIQNEKDDFLRSMMWGSLWDSVREAELDPREYVELAIKNIGTEKDELTIQTILNRVSTAMTYYIQSEPPALAGGAAPVGKSTSDEPSARPPANAGGSDLRPRLEAMLIKKMRTAPTLGQRITFYRAFLNIASTENARRVLKEMLRGGSGTTAGSTTPAAKNAATPPIQEGNVKVTPPAAGGSDTVIAIPLKTKDRFDIVTKLAILNDPDAAKLLAELEKTETSDDAKRYAYAAKAAFPAKETKEKFWNDFVGNKEISESWIEAAFGPFNSPRHAELTLPYLDRALKELPNHKRNRKIFFVNAWLASFIGGQKSQAALDVVNKFLADNPDLDRDLRLKILENVDIVERAVKIRSKFGV